MKQLKPIGISGVARSGKDTFALLLTEEFKKRGYKTKHLAFAHQLKSDLDKFCKKNFGISAYTEDTEEKKVIRHLFVGYGAAKRQQTNGTYFVNLICNKIDLILQTDKTIPIITDVRYAEHDSDEAQSIKNKYNGEIVYIERILKDGLILGPANDEEKRTLPAVRDVCNLRIIWETTDDIENLRPYAKEYVDAYLKEIENV